VQVASTEDSRSVTPAALVVPDSGHVSPSSGQVSPVEKSPEAAKLRRASGDGGSKDADASCLLDDEEAEALAVKQSGLISEDALKEEAAAAEDNVKRQQKSTDDQIDVTNISSEDRYNMLMELLNKSEFFTNYIKEKMAEKLAVQEKEVKKANEKKLKETSSGKRKRKSKVDLEDESDDEDQRNAKKIKSDDSGEQRLCNGQPISDRQPKLLSGGVMRNYQLEGYEWLAKLYENGINGILADEMGLGKTIQCIALFCHLYEMGVPGPFLVVAPLSTVPNWCNEFKRFAPEIPCILYHGTKAEREVLRRRAKEKYSSDLAPVKMRNVFVTSYEIAMNDRPVLANIKWKFLVVDEGHRLKNMECRLIKELKMYKTEHRLLLTGTPLQNNLKELFSLLNFVLPDIFDDVQVFESWFDAKEMQENVESTNQMILEQERKNNIVNMLQQIILPFLRRRVKTDVGLEIPPKKEVLVYCPLTPRQKELYKAVVEKTIADLLVPVEAAPDPDTQGRGKRDKATIDYSVFDKDDEYKNDDKFEEAMLKYSENMPAVGTATAYNLEQASATRALNFCVKSRMMDMRKAVNHPYLIDYPITDDGFYDTGADIVSICGKLRVLDQMLDDLMRRGHKILLFSQMTKMLDILGDYLNWKKLKFSRLDGTMGFEQRQENIDIFNSDPSVQVFLLSTRAGGLGINLTAADTCVIYDSDWNPQQDLQAQDRCHRIGQTKPVMVYRLVTKGTIDEKIVLRAAAKRKIEKLVIHKDKFASLSPDAAEKAAVKIDAAELLRLLNSKDHVGAVTCAEGNVLSDSDLEKLLDRSDLTWAKEIAKREKAAEKKVEGVFQVLDEEFVEQNNMFNTVGEKN